MTLARNLGRESNVQIRRYLITGILTAIPLWVTWLVLDFLVELLQRLGNPGVDALVAALEPRWPRLAAFFEVPEFRAALAIFLVVLGLYLLGWATTRVVGRRLLRAFDAVVNRIPMVKTIYGGTRRLIEAFQQKPRGVDRVVLIDFPSEEMKTVGLVTRTLEDSRTGRQVAAVYVPTTPNPTSGYLEIVPVERITPTDWTVDEAMQFIVSGGAVAPETMIYDRV